MSSDKDQEIFYLKDKVRRLTLNNAELSRQISRLSKKMADYSWKDESNRSRFDSYGQLIE